MATKRNKSGKFAKAKSRKSTGKRSSGRKSTTKGRTRRKSSKVTQAGMGNLTNLLALAGGAAIAWHYRDDARLVKLLKEPKTRYLVMGAGGLALGSGMVGKTLRIPTALRFALIGAGVANTVAAVPVMFPKLLPPPMQGTGAGMGRLTEAQMQQLRAYVAEQRAGLTRGTALVNGTGRGAVITGRMPATVPVITGAHYHQMRRAATWR